MRSSLPRSAQHVESLERRLQFAAYPAGAGVVNVQSFGAIPNDGLDDTAAIQAALDSVPSGNRVVWLPNGTYNISNTLSWSIGTTSSGDDYKRTILEGQSRDGVILKLNNSASGFTSATTPKAVIFTGNGVAQKFRNAIRDLTVDTGTGNAGAIGIQFMANNQGSMRNVKITGSGVIGLDTTQTAENGPAYISDVTVNGFATGIKTRYDVNSLTFENITLTNQTTYGFWNHGQQINIRKLNSTNANTIPVIYNEVDSKASIMLIDSTLTGTGAANSTSRAIWNRKAMYVRNLTTSGYAKAIDHDDKGYGNPDVVGPNVAEWDSHKTAPLTLNGTHTGSLNLPILDTPTVPHDAFTAWASPTSYGAVLGDATDDTAALQAAIDSGATTVFIPGGGRLVINGTVYVRNNVRRIVGLEGDIEATDTDGGKLVIQAGTHNTVVIERLDLLYNNISIENASARTLVLSSITFGTGTYIDNGSGDLFLDDVVGGNWVFNGGRVFARQFNVENEGTKVTNNGGFLWVLGLKTEKNGTKIVTNSGGSTEVMGALIYTNQTGDTWPAFINNESSLSLNGLSERNYNGDPLDIWVRETRGGVTKDFTPAMKTDRGSFYYAGYLATSTPAAPTSPAASATSTSQISVGWTDASSNEYGFKVERKTGSTGTWAQIADLAPGITSYSDMGLASGTQYYYRVRSYNRAGNSAYTAEVNATTQSTSTGYGVFTGTQDIGAVAATGSASHSNGTYTVVGSGADIWGSNDEFRYVYTSLAGDGTIVARVASVQNTNPWAKAGVMIRETLAANSRHASVVVTPSSGVSFQRRTSTGGSSSHTTTSGLAAPYWVKLVRSGNNFSAYRSPDGSTWTQVGTTTAITMASSVYVGLAVTSHADGTLCTSSFTNVSVTAGASLAQSTTSTSTNKALTSTASASHTFGGQSAGYVKDGQSSTYWRGATQSGATTGQWVQLAWSTNQSLSRLNVIGGNLGTTTLQYHDGSAWKTIAVASGNNIDRTFATVSTNKVRLYVNTVSFDRPKVFEFAAY